MTIGHNVEDKALRKDEVFVRARSLLCMRGVWANLRFTTQCQENEIFEILFGPYFRSFI